MRQKERLLHRGFQHRVQSLKRTRQASLLPAGQKRPDHIFGLPKKPSAAASCRRRLIALRSTSSSLFVVRPRREVAQRLAFSKVCHWPRPPSQHWPVGVLGGALSLVNDAIHRLVAPVPHSGLCQALDLPLVTARPQVQPMVQKFQGVVNIDTGSGTPLPLRMRDDARALAPLGRTNGPEDRTCKYGKATGGF